eukprot:COSAG02_NODE_23459_length_718_cov_0.882068_1_plen_28_part_10
MIALDTQCSMDTVQLYGHLHVGYYDSSD